MTETLEPEAPVIDPLAPDGDAPYGYTIDETTGERRPKIKAGRPSGSRSRPKPAQLQPGASPSLDELKEAAAGSKAGPEEDRAPGKAASRGRKRKVQEPVPAFRAGPIAAGMNKLYLKAGKIVRAFDQDIGQAVIDATKKESDDDVTVGEAWEELARTNPRIRRVLLKMIKGGAWGQLFACHAPILLAVIMKDAIRRHIPFGKLLQAFLSEEDADGARDVSIAEDATGLTPDDMAQAMAFAQAQMARMGFGSEPGPPGPAENPVRVDLPAGQQVTVPPAQPRVTAVRTQRRTRKR